MKSLLPRFLLALLVTAGLAYVGLTSPVTADEEVPPQKGSIALKTLKEKASYAIGLNIGGQLAAEGADIDPTILAEGLKAALTGQKPAMTEEEMGAALSEFSKIAQEEATAKAKAKGDKNRAAGDAFLNENKQKKGVKVTASGLQYSVLKQGDGASPKKTDTVKVHYHGTLINGEVFDSSVKRGEPAQFPVNRVIPGWTEALQMMKVGDKWQLVIPSDLAYGDRGTPGGPIGPGAVLIFDVELLEIAGK